LSDISPDFARLLIEFGFGDVYSRPTLDLRTKEIAVVAALTAMGTAAPQLKVHLNAALNVGVTREEITETMILMGVYAGGVERLVCRQGRIRRAGFDGVRARR
jgi:4-carboxymuconolactone decarboxylase